MNQLTQPKAEAQHHGSYGPHHSLQDLEGELQDRIFHGAVEKGSAEGIARHHDDGSQKNPDSCRKSLLFGKKTAGTQGDHHSLQPVGGKGYKHGRGIKEEVSQKGTDTACNESAEGIQKDGRGADYYVV